MSGDWSHLCTFPYINVLRVDGGNHVSPLLREHDRRSFCHEFDGQHHCCRLHRQTGRDSFFYTERSQRQALEVVSVSSHSSDSLLCPWAGQSDDRFVVLGHVPFFRMGPVPRDLRSPRFCVVPSRDRSLCDISQSSPPEILFSGARTGSLDPGRILPSVVELPGLRLSSDLPDLSSSEKDSGR